MSEGPSKVEYWLIFLDKTIWRQYEPLKRKCLSPNRKGRILVALTFHSKELNR